MNKVYAGQKLDIRASDWNALMSALTREAMTRLQIGGTVPSIVLDRAFVHVTAHRDLKPNTLVSLGEAIIDPEKRLDGFRTTLPAFISLEPTPARPMAIVEDAISVSASGRALVLGATALEIDIKDDNDMYADLEVKTSTNEEGEEVTTTSVISTPIGGPIRILWHKAGKLGIQWCYVLIGGGDGYEPTLYAFPQEFLGVENGMNAKYRCTIHSSITDYNQVYEDQILLIDTVDFPYKLPIGSMTADGYFPVKRFVRDTHPKPTVVWELTEFGRTNYLKLREELSDSSTLEPIQ